jgi:lipopolysaccharide transport system permease protein
MVNTVDQLSDATAQTGDELAQQLPVRPPRAPFRLQPSKGWVALQLGELWRYRELLYFLVWRDIKVRYKQTALGAAWAIIQPFFTMLVFSIFLGKLAKVPSDGIPYPLFSYCALVPWVFFANGLGQSSDSLVGSSNLIKKVYFPRLAIPLGVVCAGLVDFMLAFGMLLLMCLKYHVRPTHNVIWLPGFVLLAFMTSLGVGLWLSALNVKYRDVKYAVPFLSQFWMFATPIAYPASLVSPQWRPLFGLNPMAGVVEAFRWAVLGTHTAPTAMIGISFLMAALILVSGMFYFRRMEKTFADRV